MRPPVDTPPVGLYHHAVLLGFDLLRSVPMRTMAKFPLFVLSLVLLSRAVVAGDWTLWQSPHGGAGHIEYCWRSSSCTPAGCQLEVLFRNVSAIPVRFHYTIEFEKASAGGKGPESPLTGEEFIGSNKLGTSHAMTGSRISHVAIEIKQ